MEFSFVERAAFEQMGAAAGFGVAQVYGNYECAAFDAASSPVMVFVLEKDAEPSR
jgi:hypothetical protein